MEQEILVFFYGSYINPDVLKKVGYIPRKMEVAVLHGFELTITPLANIEESDQGAVYGIVATGTHAELERLYAQGVLDNMYLPRAVLVQKTSGEFVPALTYIASTINQKKAQKDYVERIAKPAEAYEFPGWYIEKIRSFLN